MKKTVKVGIIGLGARAETLLATIFCFDRSEVLVTAICDVSEARVARIQSIMESKDYPQPEVFADYRGLIASDNVDAVLVPTSWNSHLQIAEEAMKHGKYAGIEVGGASSIDELWHLVRAAESTGVSCMMLENCCYGRDELLCLNLARKGLFGELIHCECGYEHDISEMALKDGKRAEREVHNFKRNGDLYPTHGIGPVAKILRINRGNRFMTLTSTASKGRGFMKIAEKAGRGQVHYAAGDVVTTVIKCANGETITMTHCVSLPRPYTRDFRVQGTKGIYLEDVKAVHIEGVSVTRDEIDVAGNPYTVHDWTPVADIYEKYDHPIWQKYRDQLIGGHGGMDGLVLQAFFDAVRDGAPPPIDVYDCAAWMAITCLSEQSISMGGMPVAFPDFTDGKWIYEGWGAKGKWALDEVYE
ncbi:MAG: Gfo/Idh/MocA family oxidoreductase [Lentisphaerae bacterium]|nr:Gfo/Idh/MocA family oxidoreductase [Lentisphaerota bacterium]